MHTLDSGTPNQNLELLDVKRLQLSSTKASLVEQCSIWLCKYIEMQQNVQMQYFCLLPYDDDAAVTECLLICEAHFV